MESWKKRKVGSGRVFGIDRRQVIAAAIGIALGLVMYLRTAVEEQSGIRTLSRDIYGGSSREEELVVHGLTDTDEPVTIRVAERVYSREAAEQAMNQAAAALPELIRGKNPDLNTVRSPLNLPDRMPDTGIRLEWLPDDTNLIRIDGSVELEEIGEKSETGLTVVMEAEDYSRRYYYPVTIVRSPLTENERLRSGLERRIKSEDEKQKTEEILCLPEEFEGKKLEFREPTDRSWIAFPLLGVFSAMILPVWDRQKEKERIKKRGILLQEDYPEIVSRLVVLSGAGLPVMRAWEKIVRDYEKTEGGRAAYDEMALAWYQMERGMPAAKAMELFGARCGSISYRRLIGLLRQNIRNGSGQFREALENEMERAFEEERNLCRKRGEEASTKLLLPLIIMLLIVMVMVSVPAFLTFTAG